MKSITSVLRLKQADKSRNSKYKNSVNKNENIKITARLSIDSLFTPGDTDCKQEKSVLNFPTIFKTSMKNSDFLKEANEKKKVGV